MGFPLRTNSGSTQNLWGMRDYGFRGLWDKRASTVPPRGHAQQTQPLGSLDAISAAIWTVDLPNY